MSKPHYEDFASHAFRFYAKNQDQTSFRTEAEQKDWIGCQITIAEMPEWAREPLLAVYQGKGSFPENIREVASRYDMTEKYLWILTDGLLKQFAINRGLI